MTHLRYNLLFDLDDTLIPSTQIYEIAIKHCFSKAIFQPFAHEYNSARLAVKSSLPPNHTSARNRLLYFKRMLESCGAISASQCLELFNIYESQLAQLCAKAWHDLGRQNLFWQLKKKCKLYVITNENTRTQLIKLSAIDPDGSIFSGMLTSEEVGFEKPEPRIYEELLWRFNLDPKNSTMVGDSLENDVFPAFKLGANAIHTVEFLDQNEVDASGLHQTPRINKLDQLLEFLP